MKHWSSAAPILFGFSTLFSARVMAEGYHLIVSPESAAVCMPGSVDFEITVETDGPMDPITFSAATIQFGDLTVSFGTNPVFPPGSTTMTVTTGMDTQPIPSLIQVVGISPTAEADAVAEIVPAQGLPLQSPLLLSPSDSASGVARRPTLAWHAEPSVTHALVEVTTDMEFGTVLHSEVVVGNAHTLGTLLAPGTDHLWRVTPINACGMGEPSPARSFTTAVATQSVSVSTLDFGEQRTGAGPGAAQLITITNTGPVEVLLGPGALTGLDSVHFSVLFDTGEEELLPGGQRVVAVEFAPATPGEKSAALSLSSDASEGEVSVSLSGTGIGGVGSAVAPMALDFDVWPVNTSFAPQRNFVIVNLGTETLSIGDIRLEGGDAPAFFFPDPPDTSNLASGEVRSIAVAFDPTSEGPKAAFVSVDLSVGGVPQSAAITLAGEGGGPLSPLGLTTEEIVRELLGLNTRPLDVDVNTDAREDAADVVTNELAFP